MPDLLDLDDEFNEKDIRAAKRDIDKVKKEFTILEYLQPLLEANIPKNTTKLLQYVAGYHRTHLNTLETIYIDSYPPFKTGKDVGIMYECSGANKDKLDDIVVNIVTPESYKIHKKVVDHPRVLALAIVRYFLITENKKALELMKYYLGYSIYWMAYTTTFKRFTPPLGVVKYTMNSISGKFRLKQLGSVNKWIYCMVDETLAYYNELLLSGSDYEFHYILDQIRSKMGSGIKSLGNLIYANYEQGNGILDGDEVEDDGGAKNTDSRTEQIVSLATKATTLFFSEPVSIRVLQIATQRSEVGVDHIRSTIQMIKDNPKDANKVQSFYEAVFSLFLEGSKYTVDDVKSREFLVYCLNMYKKGNTTDPNMLTIRNCLVEWCTNSSPLYSQLTRGASQSSFRKSVYFYLIYVTFTSH